jgi:hypothetical protein
LIEPPESDSLELAIKALRESGAIMQPISADAELKAGAKPPTKFGYDGDRRLTVSSTPDADKDDIIVTFLGSVIPRFACDIAQVRLMIFGTALGIPCESVVLAASMVCQDPYTMPSPFVVRNREELNFKLASSYGGRMEGDKGLCSEPITLYNSFKDWLEVSKRGRLHWMQNRSLHSMRFKKFRVSIAMMASRLADMLYDMSVQAGVWNVERSESLKVVTKLKQLAVSVTSFLLSAVRQAINRHRV